MLIAFALFASTVCDTDDLRNDVDNLKDRTESLEARVSLLDDSMTTIKRLFEGGQAITEVTNTNGTYKLKLSNGETIPLTQGLKGEVAYLETIINDEGQWVVNGEVLIQNGIPVQAVGTPGKDGIVPKFRITDEGSFWQVSYDNGTSWEDVLDTDGQGVSVTSDGSGGSNADSFFEEVYVDSTGEFFVAKLKGQTETISIPIVEDLPCEITEPETGMRNGYWKIGYGKTAIMTAKIRGENTIVTAPTGWVATVSEADEMTNVATSSITAPADATGTRATADNGSDITAQVNKGASWVVAKIQMRAIQVVDSCYALCNSGTTLTINGIEVDNTKLKNATYVDSDQTITTPGIYFIKGGVAVNHNSTADAANLLFIGDDSQNISTVAIAGNYIRLKQSTETGHFLCKNIVSKAAEGFISYLSTVYADKSFANVAFDQCQIALNGKPISAIANDKRSVANFSMGNSTIKIITVTQQFIINTSSNKNQNYGNVIFRNNTFYRSSGKVNRLVLFNGSASGIASLTVENNIFISLETNTGGYVSIGNLAKTSIKDNIFWTNTDGTGDVVVTRPQVTSPTGNICADNLLYKTMTYNWQMFCRGKLSFEGAEELKALTSNPFDGGTFDLANGVFVPNVEHIEYGVTN